MCDFKPGDEIICVDASNSYGGLLEGKTYIAYYVGVTGANTHVVSPYNAVAPLDKVFVNVGASEEEKNALAAGFPDLAGWYAFRFRKPIIDETPIEASEMEFM